MRWILVVVLVGACATQQALSETDRRMDEIALRVAAVESTSQRLAKDASGTIGTLSALTARVDQLEKTDTEIRTLRGQLTALQDRIIRLEARTAGTDPRALLDEIKDMLSRIDDRVTALEGKGGRSPAKPGPVAVQSTGAGWWCVEVGDVGSCHRDESDCEDMRARFADAEDCEKTSGLSREQCVGIAAQARGVRTCRRYARAACFTKHVILRESDILSCSPTIAMCQSGRAYVMKHQTADARVKSDCKAVD